MKKTVFVVFALILIFASLAACSLFGSKDDAGAQGVNEGETLYVEDSLSLYVTKGEDIVTDQESGLTYVNSELILTAKTGVTESEVESAVKAENGKIVGAIEVLSQYQVQFENNYTLEELNSLRERLMETGLFDYCDLNLAAEVSEEYYPQSDSKWKNLWDETPSGSNWGVEAIRAPQMWDYRDRIDWTKVGVFDINFYADHEDLVFTEIYFDFTAEFKNSGDSHGTHVAGTIAAGFDNGTGITGVHPKVQLYGASTRGIESTGPNTGRLTTFTYTAGLVSLITDAGCRVINMSIAYDLVEFAASRGNLNARNHIQECNTQLERSLLTLIAKGYEFVIVKAAGNQNSLEGGSNYKYDPNNSAVYGYAGSDTGSEYGNVYSEFAMLSGIENSIVKDMIIVVGAAERLSSGQIQVADFSNRGGRVDIIAPGVDIESCIAKRGWFNTLRSGYEGDWSGTSMAAPHVSGAAAAVFGANPGLSGAEVKSIVLESATSQSYGYSNSVFTDRYRLLNAEAAVMMALDLDPAEDRGVSIPGEMSLTIGETNIIELDGIVSGSVEKMEWMSSNTDIVSVTDKGIIYGKALGEAVVSVDATISGQQFNGQTLVHVTPIARDTILVLDISGSMQGVPLTEMKKSAVAFCQTVLTDGGSNNRVGLVVYDTGVYTYELTSDVQSLISSINALREGSRTNLQGALQQAMEMMDSSGRPGAVKNIIVMTDGLPNEGGYTTYGQFSQKYSNSNFSTGYADSAFETAEQIMLKYNLYSLGYFHSLEGNELAYAKDIMQNIQNKGYYQVETAEDLEFVFADITKDVSAGARLVINIACPVDVEITYNGERLSSAGASYNDYTSFGTLQLLGRNADIKILTLSPGIDYNLEMNATGEGEMEYTVNYFDNSESIVDTRSFPGIPLTPTTFITTNTESSGATQLNVDTDNDGTIDLIWEAAANSVARQIKSNNQLDTWMIVLIVAVVICAVAAGCAVFVVQKNRNGKLVPAEGPAFTPQGGKGSITFISGELAGAVIPICDGETLNIGRDASWAHVVLNEKQISRQHCAITYNAMMGCYFVCNKSQYGTFFSDERMLPKEIETRVEKGEKIMLASGSACVLLLN